MKKLRVTVDGKSYDVLVEILEGGATEPVSQPAPAAAVVPLPAPAAAVPAPGPAAARSAEAAPGDVPSPLAGKVVAVDVTVGQVVAEGAQLATLEAMKMNTYLFAPRAGRVTAVYVKPGDGVEDGAPVLRLS